MKKWTFLVASAMLVGATPVFTGCIDNDEPEGISVLRGAKAELLRAKASVEAAKVAQVQADAALTLAQAEVQKAEAARINAIADYESAKALEQQYLAELQNIKNEEQRADLENKIKIYAEQRAAAEREAQEAAAKLEVSLTYWKGELAKQQAAYEIALKDLALAKTTLTTKQQDYLKPWSEALAAAKSNVDQASNTLEKRANLLAYAIKELDKTKAQESLFVEAKYQVQETLASWEAKQKAETVAEEATKKEITATKWDEERIKLEAQKEAADKKWSQANTKKVDLANQDATKKLAAKTNELKATYEAMAGVWNEENQRWDKESTEEFEFDPIKIQSNNPVLPQNPYVYAPYESLLKYKHSAYLDAVRNDGKLPIIYNLNNEIEMVKSWGVDENGKAYTAQSILDYQQQLAQLTADSKMHREKWNNAVAVYLNSDKIKEMDGYTALEEKSNEYNKAADLYNKAASAYYGFMNEKDAVDAEYEAGWAEIERKRDDALAANEAACNNKLAEIRDNVANLTNIHNTKVAIKNKCYDEYQQDKTDAKETAFKTALAEAQAAETALTNAVFAQPDLEKAANDKNDAQDLLSKDTYAIELAKYTEAYFKEHPNEVAETKLSALQNEYNKASVARTNAKSEFENTCWSFYYTAGLYNYYTGVTFPENEIKFGNWSVTEYLPLDLTKSIGVNREYLKNSQIASASRALFGTSSLIQFKDADGNWTYIQLGELTPARIKELLDKDYLKYNPDAESAPYQYILYRCKTYPEFGYVGRIMACELQIEQAKAYIENDGKAVKDLLAQLEAAKAGVEAQIEANNATVKVAEEAYTKSQEEYNALFTEVEKELSDATAEMTALTPVITAIEQAIKKYLSYEEANVAADEKKKAETVKEFKEALNSAYASAKEATKNAEYAYHVAVESLANVTAGKEELVAFAQKGWDDAKAKMEAAQAELEAANDALQAEIERISTVE